MSEQNETFSYTYSASQQEEIQAIRKKYLPAESVEPDKMAQLRRLDESVTKKGSVVALAVGILSSLILGFGMSLVMTDIGQTLGITKPLIPGILIGILGIAGVVAAYPLYQRITKKEQERVAPLILKLTKELANQ